MKQYNQQQIYLDLVTLFKTLLQFKNNWSKEDRVVFYQPIAMLIQDTLKTFYTVYNTNVKECKCLNSDKLLVQIHEIGFHVDIMYNVGIISLKHFCNISKTIGAIEKQIIGYDKHIKSII